MGSLAGRSFVIRAIRSHILAFLLAALLLPLTLDAETRLVSTSGAITETIFALGAGSDLVAVDLSSVYPDAATALPMIGYARMLSGEGIISMRPTLVLANADAGPPAVIDQLKNAGVNMLFLTNAHSPDAAAERIRLIGKALDKQAAAEALVQRMETDLQEASARIALMPTRPKVMFIYTRGGGIMNVAGRGTGAEAIIALAGGVNAVQDYDGYKPLTAEGAVNAAPEYILISSRGLETSGGIAELLQQPGLLDTPAGRAGRVIAMEDLLLLGFGPRLGETVRELAEKLHP